MFIILMIFLNRNSNENLFVRKSTPIKKKLRLNRAQDIYINFENALVVINTEKVRVFF